MRVVYVKFICMSEIDIILYKIIHLLLEFTTFCLFNETDSLSLYISAFILTQPNFKNGFILNILLIFNHGFINQDGLKILQDTYFSKAFQKHV